MCRELTQGSLGTALGDDTASGSALDGAEVLTDASVVGGLAVRLARDGLIETGDGTRGHVIDGLGTHNGGEGNGDERVLHVEY